MRARQFDRLAKFLAAPRSRRELLRASASLGLAGLAGRFAAPAAAAVGHGGACHPADHTCLQNAHDALTIARQNCRNQRAANPDHRQAAFQYAACLSGAQLAYDAAIAGCQEARCDAGLDCRSGICCFRGEQVCPPGVCVDVTSDPNNCGRCGHACPVCINGRCCVGAGQHCAPSGTPCCEGACDPRTHTCCAGLGASCAADSACCAQPGVTCGPFGTCCLSANSFCSADADCCSGHCDPGSGRCCAGPGQDCAVERDCCQLSNTTCQNNVCCLPAGQACRHNQDCCNGHCDPTSQACCLANGASCAGDVDCCGGSCVNGTCCTSHLKSCGSDGDCCTGTGDICPLGVCCRDAGGVCGTVSDCCFAGACQNGACCLADGLNCAQDRDCCNGACVGGVCRGSCPSGQHRCPSGACAQCCADNDCPSGTCVGGVCQSQTWSCAGLSRFAWCDHAQKGNCECVPDVGSDALQCVAAADGCVGDGHGGCAPCAGCADGVSAFCVRNGLGQDVCVLLCHS